MTEFSAQDEPNLDSLMSDVEQITNLHKRIEGDAQQYALIQNNIAEHKANVDRYTDWAHEEVLRTIFKRTTLPALDEFLQAQTERLEWRDDPDGSELDEIWDEDLDVKPTLIPFHDCDRCLLYAATYHSIFGTGDAGKSFLCAYICLQFMREGRYVLWLEADNNTKKKVITRLRKVGADREMVRTYFRFHEVTNLSVQFDRNPDLVILDAVNPVLMKTGRAVNSSGEAMDFYMDTMVKPFLKTGAVFIAIDHSNEDGRDSFGNPIRHDRPSNNSRKVQATQGMLYQLVREVPSNVGSIGRARLILRRDMPGGSGVNVNEDYGYVIYDGTKGDGSCAVNLVSTPTLQQLADQYGPEAQERAVQRSISACSVHLDRWRNSSFVDEALSANRLDELGLFPKSTFYDHLDNLIKGKWVRKLGTGRQTSFKISPPD